VCFQEDLTLQVAAEALTWQTPGYGAFQPALAQIRSSEATTRQGLDFNFDMALAQLQWAKRVHRFMVGVDHNIIKGLFFRTGMTLDIRGNASWACGLGIYPTDWLAIDIGYQNDMFPELETEFGCSRTFTISVSLSL